MILSSKQIRHLKSIAMTQDVLFQVGKNEISSGFIKMIDDALEAREVIKFRILNNSSANIREVGLDVSIKTNSSLVQIVGHVITLYRPSKKEIYKI